MNRFVKEFKLNIKFVYFILVATIVLLAANLMEAINTARTKSLW